MELFNCANYSGKIMRTLLQEKRGAGKLLQKTIFEFCRSLLHEQKLLNSTMKSVKCRYKNARYRKKCSITFDYVSNSPNVRQNDIFLACSNLYEIL